MDKSYATQLALPRLNPEDSRRVVQAVLHTVQLPAGMQQDILAKAAGNPLFLEELDWVIKEQGAHRRAPEVPDTVHAVLAARIDLLPPDVKRVLQTAAVIGPVVPVALLQAIAACAEAELQRCLTSLQAAEFLYETRLVPERAYTFKHALTHEVAYGSVLQEQRRVLHARIVEALEALAADPVAEVASERSPDQVGRLAYHALRGELWEKALAYLRQASTMAATRSAYQEVEVCVEQALTALQHLPARRDLCEQAIDLRFDLRNAFIALEKNEHIPEVLRQAETLAKPLDDQRRLGWIVAYMTQYFWTIGDQERALATGQQTLVLANALEDVTLQIAAEYFLGATHYARGDYRQARDHLERTITVLIGERSGERFGQTGLASVQCRAYLVWSLVELGEFSAGIRRAEEAVQIAEAATHSFSLSFAYRSIGINCLYKGEFHRAIPALERALHICQTANYRSHFPPMASTSFAPKVFLEDAFYVQNRSWHWFRVMSDPHE
jgi:predicted ATPase